MPLLRLTGNRNNVDQVIKHILCQGMCYLIFFLISHEIFLTHLYVVFVQLFLIFLYFVRGF